MQDYLQQFFSEKEGAPRAAVKRLTAQIEKELLQSTVNAPDWCVRKAFCELELDIYWIGLLYTPREWPVIYSGKRSDLLTLKSLSPYLKREFCPFLGF